MGVLEAMLLSLRRIRTTRTRRFVRLFRILSQVSLCHIATAWHQTSRLDGSTEAGSMVQHALKATSINPSTWAFSFDCCARVSGLLEVCVKVSRLFRVNETEPLALRFVDSKVLGVGSQKTLVPV